MSLTESQKQKIREEEEFRASVKQSLNKPTKGDKNKLIASLLALFLGGLGIHKFYLGQSKKGWLYLLFCWTGIPVLFGFFEGIGLLTMSEDKFQNKFN